MDGLTHPVNVAAACQVRPSLCTQTATMPPARTVVLAVHQRSGHKDQQQHDRRRDGEEKALRRGKVQALGGLAEVVAVDDENPQDVGEDDELRRGLKRGGGWSNRRAGAAALMSETGRPGRQVRARS